MLKRRDLPIVSALITVVIAYSVMPIVSRFFSTYLTTYSYMVLLLVLVAIIIVSKDKEYLSGIVFILTPLLIWEFLIYFVTNPAAVAWGYQMLLDCVPVMLGYFIIKKLGFAQYKFLFTVLFIAFIVTTITTVVGLQVYPDASRYIATISDSNSENAVTYDWANIGGYSFVYFVVLTYPMVIYGYKRKKIHVIFLIIFAILTFILIVNSGYTIALLLFTVSSVFAFFKRDLKVADVILIILISAIVILLLFQLFAELLNSIANVIDNKTIASRLRDLAGGKEGLEQSEDNRLELYLISFTSFLKSPLFGGIFGSYKVGGHSFILDSLSRYGLVGGAVLFFVYRMLYRTFFKPLKSKTGYGYVFWTFIQVLILSLLNTGLWLYVLGFFIPIVVAYIDKKGNKNENSLDSKLGSRLLK